MTWILKHHSSKLLLIPPFSQQQQLDQNKVGVVNEYDTNGMKSDDDSVVPQTTTATAMFPMSTMEQLLTCPAKLLEQVNAILQFSTLLLRNSTSKQLYASVPAVSDLLAAGDDGVADSALALLTALSIPPPFHKQQVPEHPTQMTQLHLAVNNRTSGGASSSSSSMGRNNNGGLFMDVHDRLMATSRAWGTRATGMGLFVTVTADDSIYGQGELPPSMGEVNFCYYNATTKKHDGNASSTVATSASDAAVINAKNANVESTMQEISLTLSEMLVVDGFSSSSDYSTESCSNQNFSSLDDMDTTTDVKSQSSLSKKRRKVVAANTLHAKTSQKKDIKSTIELFFLAIEKAGGIHKIPADRWFPLLADIRLARSFHSQASRFGAVGRRLRALIASLHAHPSHEVMSGYFQAQPELCVEIVDLLRPVVSSVNVSTTSSVSEMADGDINVAFCQDAISNLVTDTIQSVPFEVRMLAVEALTALVSRRESSSGLLTGSPRLSSVLVDLGVGKGQYLGLLPTLIRFSLSSFSDDSCDSAGSKLDEVPRKAVGSVEDAADNTPSMALDVGLAFVEATMAPAIPRKVEVDRAFNFIDAVLTLTSSVVGTPSGTSGLVDCGLIPALLKTISMKPESILEGLIRQHESTFTASDLQRLQSWLRYIVAQAVQILEGTFITHSNSLTAFHDLQGVEVMTTRLSQEVVCTKNMISFLRSEKANVTMDVALSENDDVAMEEPTETRTEDIARISASQRVLLYSVVNCLTVVFHQESSNSATAPTGGAQLRKKELTDALSEILSNVNAYGGHLVSLIATLLSDVMNSDPHVVHYVHKSGISDSFLDMVVGNIAIDSDGNESFEPLVPPVPELISSITNVISALSLTDDGAKSVAARNPFPSLLRLLYHPDYAMPKSRCLLNDMTGMLGNGLDEIIRHVDRLKHQVLNAIADAMKKIVVKAEDLLAREELTFQFGKPTKTPEPTMEDERTCLIQYVLNFGQLLEQILQNEDNCEPFVEAGGLDAILRLFPLLLPSSVQFISFVSCLSSPSVTSLHHSTTEESLYVTIKCIELRYSFAKHIQKLIAIATDLLDTLEESQRELQVNGVFSLNVFPQDPCHKILGVESHDRLVVVSKYLRRVANVQWVTRLLASAIKGASQRDTGQGWSPSEREWKDLLASDSFCSLVGRLSSFHRESLFEVCRARTSEGFDLIERQRLMTRQSRSRYRLRVVCTEGAVIRDGIEIDSCANIGSLEVGDIIDAYDRCINSSGILRYRTKRGWVSEMTTGHEREPITEVFSVWDDLDEDADSRNTSKIENRVEAGVPDLRSVTVSVLARSQSSYTDLYVALSKLVIQGIRSLTLPVSFANGDAGLYVSSILRLLTSNVKKSISHDSVVKTARSLLDGGFVETDISFAGASMYLGCVFSQLQVCLFDDKRERRMLNFPLLVYLVSSDTSVAQLSRSSPISEVKLYDTDKKKSMLGFFDAIRYIFRFGLSDFVQRADDSFQNDHSEPVYQRVGRSVAASYPPLISLLRKLVSTPWSSSPAASIMSRMKWKDVSRLLSKNELDLDFIGHLNDDDFFHPESLVSDQVFMLSTIASETWIDKRMLFAPPFLTYPIAGLVGDIVLILEDLSKKKQGKGDPRTSERLRLSDLMRQRQEDEAANATNEDEFEASDEAITRLMEMGFSRDHAIDALESTRSNRVETAMDYALTNDPPSQSTIELRCVGREERARQRAERGTVPRETVESEPDSNGRTAMDVEELQEGNRGVGKNDTPTARNTLAKSELAKWIDEIPSVSLNLLSSMPPYSTTRSIKSLGRVFFGKVLNRSDGDGESEALTVVLSSLVLDVCHKFIETRTNVVSSLMSQLKGKLSKSSSNGEECFSVSDESESSVSALCHAAVLVARALPKTRLYVLKEGLVHALISCLQTFLASLKNREQQEQGAHPTLPMWLSPSLLLLDLMSQPIVAFFDEETVKDILDNSPDDEFRIVQREHEEQVRCLFDICDRWLNLSSDSTETPHPAENVGFDGESPVSISGDKKDIESERFEKSHFSRVPAYFPLVPVALSHRCLEICHSLLVKSNEIHLSPGVSQSVLLLLFRLLQSPKTAEKCLQLGMAESILALPKQSSFTGNTGLVTLVFRWLLEDDATLLTAMEAEIRGIVSTLHSKQDKTAEAANVRVSLVLFMEAATPLLCRDPATFFKSLVLSVSLEKPSRKSDTTQVTLISPSERLRRMDSTMENTKTAVSEISDPEGQDLARLKSILSGGKAKRKSTSRNTKREQLSNKKGKKEKSDTAKILPLESPAVHITGLLIQAIVTSYLEDDANSFAEKFFSTGSMLEILADLVVAVPACASAVHNYRLNRSKDKIKKISSHSHSQRHAIPPPKNFVAFLLNYLLPQDRWSIRNDPQVWTRRKDLSKEETALIDAKKKKAYHTLKVSQTSGRLLVSLAVRPGEGRKRVIADLVFAMCGCRLGHGSSSLPSSQEAFSPEWSIVEMNNSELHAIHSWGEVCLGIAAPRSSGKNLDGISSLSIDNIRLLLEHGMVHALLHCCHRVGLFHPMASHTFGALLVPLEVLTRASVTDAVKNMVKKEKQSKDANKTTTPEAMRQEISPHAANGAAEDELILDDTSHLINANNAQVSYELLVEESLLEEVDSHRNDGGLDDAVDEDIGTDDSSNEESGDEDEDETDESDDDDMDEEEDSEGDDSNDESSEDIEEEEEVGEWEGYNNSFVDDPDYDGDEGDVTDHVEDNIDEGWTRVESNPFNGMGETMGMERFALTEAGRSRGFIDAAEAMIGTLLRNEELSGDALAEIEGTLGIRIMQAGRALHGTWSTLRPSNGDGGFAEALGSRVDSLGTRILGTSVTRNAERVGQPESMGTYPHVHQRSPPDFSYSSFDRNGQRLALSSMELFYGGLSFTGGRRNYDVATPIYGNCDQDEEISLSQMDLLLFPGGPMSAANTHTTYSLHPLLCGVDLPPMNSLVSDILPHGICATRQNQITTQRPGVWTNPAFPSVSVGGFMASTSNTNIVRANRTTTGAVVSGRVPTVGSRLFTGPIGWTDEGLPVDATVALFSSALESALDSSARSALGQDTPVQAVNEQDIQRTSEPIAESASDRMTTGTSMLMEENGASLRDESESHQINDQEIVVRSEGEMVASSLVAGLRLSADIGNSGLVTSETGEAAGEQAIAESIVLDTAIAQKATNSSVDDLHENSATSSVGVNVYPADLTVHEVADNGNGESPINVSQNVHGLACPPGVDLDVFKSLPFEMQQDCIDQHAAAQELAAQLNGSSLDPDVLAALPEEMRREVIEQDRQDRRMREQDQSPADPSHAEEMDNASFIASLAPELREEILITADDAFLDSLPPGIIAEAQILRERASVQHRRLYESSFIEAPNGNAGVAQETTVLAVPNGDTNVASRRRTRSGMIKVESNRSEIVYLPEAIFSPFAVADLKALFRLMYLLCPVQPPRLLQKLFLNLCANPRLREVIVTTFINVLHEDGDSALQMLESLASEYDKLDTWSRCTDALFSTQYEFPPFTLLGAAPDFPEYDNYNYNSAAAHLRRRHGAGTAASLAASLPKSAGGMGSTQSLPPAVATRLVDTLIQLCKSPRFCLHLLTEVMSDGGVSEQVSTCFERLLELLGKPIFSKSSGNLDQLLTLLEACVAPLSHVSKGADDELDIPQRDVDAAAASGKEYVEIPRVVVSQSRLQMLCSILRMETCRDTAFTKVNTIVRRLCRIGLNRGYVLAELASVAHALGADAFRDLRALRIRMENSVSRHKGLQKLPPAESYEGKPMPQLQGLASSISSSVTLSTSTSEMKLLRVLQTLQALCNDSGDDTTKKSDGGAVVSEELAHLLRQMQFDDLWDELSLCLKVVQVLEGVKTFEEEEQKASENLETNDEGSADENGGKTKKLRNSAAGLLTRFLPSIEAFFVANASSTRPALVASTGQSMDDDVSGQRLADFVTANRLLINALIRNNASLLDKGLRALVQVPRCRGLLDFDVKRQWFKTQVRRLRQQASRRHGSLRLHIRRKHVFEDAYHQLQPRNSDEMRGRLHVTFRNEEGVDAGGVSREFFGILAKEMFNPNYALFTSTEDGCTFQPNPNSIINPDHLSYFRFVGRVVGKAVADGFLLDAHFTRSLYKHLLGVEPTHHDMEAIDPDYYRNLKTILEFNLSDIGLDLTFSIEDHSFGRSQVIDLIPNGRSVPVTEETKDKYVRLVCQHRMTTAIESQIKSYLAGFYELVSPELIAIFSPRELELLISGLPDIDVHDLKKNTDYVGWKATDKEIEWFWSILFALSRNEIAAFLQFVTGSSKVPLAGFSELQGMRGIQKFAIHKAGGTKGSLMSAHTCFNSLDLPVYDSEEMMREKLLYAINEGAGAFLFA